MVASSIGVPSSAKILPETKAVCCDQSVWKERKAHPIKINLYKILLFKTFSYFSNDNEKIQKYAFLTKLLAQLSIDKLFNRFF